MKKKILVLMVMISFVFLTGCVSKTKKTNNVKKTPVVEEKSSIEENNENMELPVAEDFDGIRESDIPDSEQSGLSASDFEETISDEEETLPEEINSLDGGMEEFGADSGMEEVGVN